MANFTYKNSCKIKVLPSQILAYHTQGFFIRPPGPNRRPPVPVYRTGWTGYRLKPVKLKFEFKTRSYTGFEHLTGRFDRLPVGLG